MDEQDRVKEQTISPTPQAPIVSLVTLTDSTLATIVRVRDPEHTRREIAVTWIRGSLIAIAMQLGMVMFATFRARDLTEITTFLNTTYPLMLRFNITVICPPLVYMIASYFAKKANSSEQ